MTDKKRIAVLVSGAGTNLQAIIDAIKIGELPNTEISIVISNKKDAFALNRAALNKINHFFLDPKLFKSNTDFDKELIEAIKKHNIDLIILAGYTKILSEIFTNTFQNKIINIHPALLPDFGGKGMYGKKVHETVLKSGAKESGCTAHFVINEVDAGPIIDQIKVPILDSDTVESLSKRVLLEEHKLLVRSIKKVLFDLPFVYNV